jgi:hypothetical protein
LTKPSTTLKTKAKPGDITAPQKTYEFTATAVEVYAPQG